MSNNEITRYTADAVDIATLSRLVNQGTWQWAYAERPDGTELTWFDALDAQNEPWSSWHHARLFDEQNELAWWRGYDGHFTCRLLTAETPENPLWQAGERYSPLTLPDKKWQPEETLLHGRWNGGSSPPTWSEPRIPRYLEYPVDPNAELNNESRGVLTTAVYRGKLGDVLVRYVSVGVWSSVANGGAA